MDARAIRLFTGALAAACVACEGPPSEAVRDPDAAGPPDAALSDAAPDASPADAPPDAAPPDAPPDAGPDAYVDPQNPYGILVTDITPLSFLEPYTGGSLDEDTWGIGSGAAVGDLNGDGALDLVLARIDNPLSVYPGGPPELLINDDDGLAHFTPMPAFADLVAGALAHSATLGDYDADGDLDVFIGASGPDFLLQNDGTGQFTDVTAAAGVAGADGDDTVGALFADVNHDGMLDLYVSDNDHDDADPPELANRLYLNLADGTFADVSIAAMADVQGRTHTAAAFDLSGTGQLDLYVANDGAPEDAWLRPVLFDDQGVPGYEDVAGPRGVVDLRASMGIGIADLDGDTTPDFYISDWGENDVYVNPTPGGPVTLETALYGLGVETDPFGILQISWSVRFVDLDRDGNLEVLVVTGGVTDLRNCFHYHQLDWFLRRASATGAFEEITAKVGLPSTPVCTLGVNPINGRGAVWGDLDGDGDDDVVITPFIEEYRVYRNDTPWANHVVRVRLVGTVSSPDPIGATLLVTRVDGRVEARFRYAGGDTYSQSDSVLEVGLGSAGATGEVLIRWPSGITQRIDGLPGFALDTTVTVVEPNWLAASPRVVEPGDPPAELVYTVVGPTGAPLGPAGAGRVVTCSRSDGLACDVADRGDGTYAASLPHPGVARRTVVTVVADGLTLPPRPAITFH